MTEAPVGARARARADLTRQIKESARAQLGSDGAAGLSLRAVARDVGLVSSAVYRYYGSRDELLTALIVDAYTSVADAAEQAEREVRHTDLERRFVALCHAMRTWALAHPHEYALIFGSPVPGYVAPTDTIDPAARIPLLLLGILADAAAEDGVVTPLPAPVPRSVHADLRALRDAVAPALDDGWLVRGIRTWAQIVGLISFELFGHLHNVVTDYRAHFELQMRVVAADLGLAGTAGRNHRSG
ncbi:MAG TPA: TetR/AcrR family transcriptional regulator [Mycobacteriales bacterium]